ncbi:MAG TPA: hypothetical protein VFW11_10220 [Cyclobacteriaceae bacterium]|nr:hypothetical protein [Cyclobacteriaceae bacterium]
MAKATVEIVEVLRRTVRRLERSDDYQWGHMGSCNCGFLAQEITHLRKEEIHARAMSRYGDWSEQLNDYCPTSGFLMDDLISEILAFGFDRDDLVHLERLSHPKVLAWADPAENFQYNEKDDAIRYLLTWADMLENEMLDAIKLKLPEPIESAQVVI